MMPILPPGWVWEGNNVASKGYPAVQGATPDETADLAWKQWEKDSGVTRAQWEKMSEALAVRDALAVIETHRGSLSLDHKDHDIDDETCERYLCHVTLWRAPDFGVGASAGGATVVEATAKALERLRKIDV